MTYLSIYKSRQVDITCDITIIILNGSAIPWYHATGFRRLDGMDAYIETRAHNPSTNRKHIFGVICVISFFNMWRVRWWFWKYGRILVFVLGWYTRDDHTRYTEEINGRHPGSQMSFIVFRDSTTPPADRRWLFKKIKSDTCRSWYRKCLFLCSDLLP